MGATATRRRPRRPRRSRWTEAHVRRLFWRAGFGARPAEARTWARRGKAATIRHLLDGGAPARLVGRPPSVPGFDPENEWSHDVLWWLDRMVRTTRPLEEKLTLFWHDHFATSDQPQPLLLAQNRTLRRHAFGPFRDLLRAVVQDTAMLLFLSLADSDPEAPNENFARELLELFGLGGGYTERDVREISRALTGFRSHWPDDGGLPRTSYDPERHDGGEKTIFGRRGRFDWEDVVDLVIAHPAHAPFLVGKLFEFFVGAPPSPETRRALAATYRGSGHVIRPVVKAILEHPALYRRLDDPDMVKAPVVLVAGALRTSRGHVHTAAYGWLLDGAGQFPLHPPSVAGWEWGPAWLSSNAMRTRWDIAGHLIRDRGPLRPRRVPSGLSPARHVALAKKAAGEPWTSSHTDRELLRLAQRSLRARWMEPGQQALMTQRVLRHLLVAGPDGQLH